MKKDIIYFVSALIMMASISVASFCHAPNEKSYNENRTLKSEIKFDYENINEGYFQKDVEEYINDQFPLRNQTTLLTSNLKRIIGYKDINGVYLSKDDYLIEKVSSIDMNKAEKNIRLVNKFIDDNKLDRNKITFMFIPDGIICMKDKLPEGASVYNADSFYELVNKYSNGANVIDLRHDLSEGDYMFFRTDHHWSYYGAYCGYKAYMESKGKVPQPIESFGLKEITTEFRGSLHSKVLLDDVMDDTIYVPSNFPKHIVDFYGEEINIIRPEYLELKNKYDVYFGGNHGIVVITVEGNEDKPVLFVIKDSFFNSMVPYMLNDYSKIVFVDLRHFNESVAQTISQYQPDEILFLQEVTQFVGDNNLPKLFR